MIGGIAGVVVSAGTLLMAALYSPGTDGDERASLGAGRQAAPESVATSFASAGTVLLTADGLPSGQQVQVATKPAKVSRRVLVYLKSRRHTLTVYSGERFSVSSRDGATLAADLSAEELERSFPALSRFYRFSYAEAWAGL